MSLICITGHQGTGKSTLLHELRKLGYTAYGLDEEKVAGYFNTVTNAPSEHIPQGLDRNLAWRATNVWRVDINKVRALATSTDTAPTFYLGYATNIEDVWDICDTIIILQLDDTTTIGRLEARTNNSFGKHPGELQLAIQNSRSIHDKAVNYSRKQVHFIDATLAPVIIVKEIAAIATSLTSQTKNNT